jgi:hypothetical protein
MHRDIFSLLALAVRHGFVAHAILGLAATFFSPYRSLRKTIGLSCYSCEAVLAKLTAAGFAARRLPANVGPSAHRLCFLAERLATRSCKRGSGGAGAGAREVPCLARGLVRCHGPLPMPRDSATGPSRQR